MGPFSIATLNYQRVSLFERDIEWKDLCFEMWNLV